MKNCISILVWLSVMSFLITGCESITDQEEILDRHASVDGMALTYTNDTCVDECIDPENPEYYEKSDTKIVNWGNENNPKTKTVEIKYYNTLTQFVLEVRSSNAISDLLMDEVSIKNFDGVIPPDTWQQITFPLDEGWDACDIWSFALEVIGAGTPAMFDVEYQLVGACTGFDCGIDTITDADGNTYNTILIGDQCWLKQNLRATKYSDEQPIPSLQDAGDWAAAVSDGYAWYYNFTEEQKVTYGALYNWYAVETGNLCPNGWNVPSDADWKTLEMTLGMTQEDADAHGERGAGVGDQMKEAGTAHWLYGNNGNNSSGFTALGAGTRQAGGLFNLLQYQAMFWSSTPYVDPYIPSDFSVWNRGLFYGNDTVSRYTTYSPRAGYSVRCVMNEE